MNKLILHSLTAMATCFIIGFFLGMLTSNKLTKQVKTTQIVTAEVKKQEVAIVQQTQKDLTTVKETHTETIVYSPKGKIQQKTFTETNYGTKTQIGTQTSLNSVVLDSSFSKVDSTTISTYQSTWMFRAGYMVPLDEEKIYPIQLKNFEIGVGYRLLGNLYGDIATNLTIKYIKLDGILLL
ncbi:MAG TPA: hypothetical protein VN703_00480 [Candidatus Sulfopaludibacter sp.]|nr:hypothetical protein [Candidatus Sulfopaludibacter sp.]